MKKKLSLFFIFVLYIVVCAVPTYADEKAASPLGFSYEVVKPENQKNNEVGYFDLKMTPGQKQNVQIQLTNGGEEPYEVVVSLNGAKTNGNGVIEYGPAKIDNDKSLKYDFVDVVKAPESIVVPAKSTIPLDLEITMPEASFDGVISGGIQLKGKTDEEALKKQSGVINEYAFMIGMLLSETDTVVKPKLELNRVYAGLSNYRNSVFVNFSNVEAAYLENLTLEVQITKSGEEAVLYDTKKANMRVAPNSLVDFPISMNGEKMVPGKYRAKINATSGEDKWSWDQEFEITDEDADKYNSQDVDLVQEQGINWMLVGIIAAGLILLLVIIFVIVRMVRKKKEAQRKANSKRKKKKPVSKR